MLLSRRVVAVGIGVVGATIIACAGDITSPKEQARISAAADLVASTHGRHQHQTHRGHLLVVDEVTATLSDDQGHTSNVSPAVARKLGRAFDRMNYVQDMLIASRGIRPS